MLEIVPVVSYFSTALCSFPPFVCCGCICLLCCINYSLTANEYFIRCWTPSSYLHNLVMSLFYFCLLFFLHLSHPLVSVGRFMYWMFACLLIVNTPWFTSIGAIQRDDVDLVPLLSVVLGHCLVLRCVFVHVHALFVCVPMKQVSLQVNILL